jgi:hypothetical protein
MIDMTSNNNYQQEEKQDRILTKLSSFAMVFSACASNFGGKLLATTLLEAAGDESKTVSSAVWSCEVTRFLL